MERYEGRKKLKYRYYDTPDGEEYLEKLWWLTKPSIQFGLFFGVSDVLVITKPNGWLPLIERLARVSIRPILTAVLFETSVYMATKLRKKDDGFNHAFGGAVCGYYWGRFIGFYPISIPLTIACCVALYNFKQQRVEGVQMVYDESQIEEEHDHGPWTRFNKWTTTEKIPRTWLTAEEAAQKGIQA